MLPSTCVTLYARLLAGGVNPANEGERTSPERAPGGEADAPCTFNHTARHHQGTTRACVLVGPPLAAPERQEEEREVALSLRDVDATRRRTLSCSRGRVSGCSLRRAGSHTHPTAGMKTPTRAHAVIGASATVMGLRTHCSGLTSRMHLMIDKREGTQPARFSSIDAVSSLAPHGQAPTQHGFPLSWCVSTTRGRAPAR
jgi:hypothetical protein